jgi:hypothetical protein
MLYIAACVVRVPLFGRICVQPEVGDVIDNRLIEYQSSIWLINSLTRSDLDDREEQCLSLLVNGLALVIGRSWSNEGEVIESEMAKSRKCKIRMVSDYMSKKQEQDRSE